MTWSIVARDASGAFGIAIASRFFAVGALCPHARERRRRAGHAGAGQSAATARAALDALARGAAAADDRRAR